MKIPRHLMMLTAVHMLLAFIGNGSVCSQTTLYDNTEGGPVSGPRMDSGDRFLAQQFLSGECDSIASVSVNLKRFSSSGSLTLEIWDQDESGAPGNAIGSVGTKDSNSIPSSFGFVDFDNSITGLTPNTPYYVVLDALHATPLGFGVLSPSDGTSGATKVLGKVGSRWRTIDSLVGAGPNGERANYWQMSVLSNTEDVPCNSSREIDAESSLYDNISVEPFPYQFDDVIGLKFDDRTEPLAQQFRTGDNNNLNSVTLNIQRIGSPTGEVAVEIWEGSEANVPATRLATVGSFDVAAISSTRPETITLDALVTGLDRNSSYYVVLNNQATDITSSNTYRFGMLGRVDDEQAEGTNGAEHMLASSTAGATWRPLGELLGGCHPIEGTCANYLRMSVTSAALLGDFDENGSLDASDIDLLSGHLVTTPNNRGFDLNNDGTLTNADRVVWVHELSGTVPGDANLDGMVEFSDFLALSNQFEQPGGWGEGDFDGSGMVNFTDFLALSANYGHGVKATAAAVPEPSSVCLSIFVALGLFHFRKSR